MPFRNLLVAIDRLSGSALMGNKQHFHISCISWPAWSLDLTIPYFFLWGCLKKCEYLNCPHATQEVKHAVRDEMATVNQELLW